MEHEPSAYDREYTFSRIAMVQRRMVWEYLDGMLEAPDLRILELNCGTGVDAIHLARKGHRVVATDISAAMLRIAREKARQMGVEQRIVHEQLAFEDLRPGRWEVQFDLVFSNFGGLNCIDRNHLAELVAPLAAQLKPGGRFVAVLMPDRCASETLYHLLGGRWSDAFRRGREEPVWAGLSGTGAVTWYHSPKQVIELFASHFRKVALRPIGLFVPQARLEHRLGHRSGLLERSARLDRLAAHLPWTARYADHYLLDLELRPLDRR